MSLDQHVKMKCRICDRISAWNKNLTRFYFFETEFSSGFTLKNCLLKWTNRAAQLWEASSVDRRVVWISKLWHMERTFNTLCNFHTQSTAIRPRHVTLKQRERGRNGRSWFIFHCVSPQKPPTRCNETNKNIFFFYLEIWNGFDTQEEFGWKNNVKVKLHSWLWPWRRKAVTHGPEEEAVKTSRVETAGVNIYERGEPALQLLSALQWCTT